MNGLIAWFVRNRVAANLLMALIVAGGLVGLSSIRVQVVPDFSPELISISVTYPGASPWETEEAVCARIEDRLMGLAAVRHVRSVAREGISHTMVEVLYGADVRQTLDDVKAQLDTIDSFPEEAEEPVVQLVDPPARVLSVAISGPADENSLTHLGEQVRDEVVALSGITLVELTGVRPSEISVEASEQALRRHGLTFDDVVQAVRRSSLDLPGGMIKSRDGEILLRVTGQATRVEEFEQLAVISRKDGTRLTLGEVATVVDGFAETGQSVRFDGHPAVLVEVFRVGDQDANEIAEKLHHYIAEAQSRMPDGIRLVLWQDETVLLRGLLGAMMENARDGFLLVVLVLALFLRPRLAIWVAVGIPLAFLGTLSCLPLLDQSINLTSLQGFILVLGILVDDAIVVGENIYRHARGHQGSIKSIIEGVQEVAAPVFSSVATTIIAFVPLLLIPGILGQLMRVMTLVVILALAFSLLESLLILPSHLVPSRSATSSRKSTGAWIRAQGAQERLQERFVRRVYLPALEKAVAWRFTTLALAVALFLLSIGMVASGRLRYAFFPPVDADRIVVTLTLPQGTSPEATEVSLRRIESSVERLRAELVEKGEPEAIRHVLTTVGSQPNGGVRFSDPGRVAISGSHLGEVVIELAPAEARRVPSAELRRRLRELTGPIPDAVTLAFEASFIDTGRPIDIQLAGSDLAELREAAAELKAALGSYPGVTDIADSLQPGKQELRLSLSREAEALGLTLADLAQQVRQAFHGEEIQRAQRGRHELKVMVRYPETERRWLANFENMHIRTRQGAEVPLAVAAQVTVGRGLAAIHRIDGRRTVQVTADVDPIETTSLEVLGMLQSSDLPELLGRYHGVSYKLAGQQQEQQRASGNLLRYTLIAFFLIYALLAASFGSYLQPLIVMSAVPFGMIGAIWGHLLMGHVLTFGSILGFVALSGVVVNDSLILVATVNRRLNEGKPVENAIFEASVERFRPIVLTSITTFAGLFPLLFETSVHAKFLAAMTISLAYGILFATLVTLFLVPVGYRLFAGLGSPAAGPDAGTSS